jgi:PAS domain S-box-containing protein
MTGTPDAETLFEQAPCGLLLVTVDGRILRVNATFCAWLDLDRDEVLARRLPDLLTVGARLFHQTHWAPLMQIQGSVAEVKLDVRHRDGHKVPMLFNAVRRRHGEQVFDEVAAVVVTDRQKYEAELLIARAKAEAAQAELKAANLRKDEFLATLAHELRNPLAPLRNVVQLLRLRHFDDAQLLWARDVLERQTTHMSLLVDDLLEMSRITQGKVRLRKERLDLAQALGVALEAAEPLIATAGHQLGVALPERPVHVHADATRVTQMILNLLNNAAKYTPEGGRIDVAIRRDGEQATVSVRDSGIGLSAEHLTTVFDMFSQITPAVQRAEGGLGIGLALVRGLAEMHGGHVAAASAGVGQGSEFTITLPALADDDGLAATAAAVAAPAPADEAAPAGARRVLVVDDNVDAAESLSMLLELQGHEVRVAHDGPAALQACEAFGPDLVLLDIGLPRMDGYEVARRMRAAAWGRAVRLVALTGWGQQRDIEAARQAGFDDHATKPIDDARLRAVLAAV